MKLKGKTGSRHLVMAGWGKADLYECLLNQRVELGLEKTVHFLSFNGDPPGFLFKPGSVHVDIDSRGFFYRLDPGHSEKLVGNRHAQRGGR